MLDIPLEAPRVIIGRSEPAPSSRRAGRTVEKYNWTVAELWRIPERAGKYFVYGHHNGLHVFEGRAENVRRCLLDHFREQDVGFSPAYVEVELTPVPVGPALGGPQRRVSRRRAMEARAHPSGLGRVALSWQERTAHPGPEGGPGRERYDPSGSMGRYTTEARK